MSLSAIQSDPITTLPFLYVSGMSLSVAGTAIMAIAPGQCRDSNDNIDMPIGYPNLQGYSVPVTLYNGYIPPLLLNSAVSGVNGLDAGSIAASTQYAIYVIANSHNYNQVAGIITLASNAYPLLPAGYDSYRCLGYVTTDSSSHFLAASVLNLAYAKSYYLAPAISVLSGGTSATFAAVALTSAVPTTTAVGVSVTFLATFTPAAAGDIAYFRPTGSSATTGLVSISGVAAGVVQQQYITVLSAVATGQPSIDYELSSSSDALSLSVVAYSYTTQ